MSNKTFQVQEILNRVFDATNNRLVVIPRVPDDQLLLLGSDGDGVLLNRSTALTANTALTGVLVGTPVTPVAIAANSLLIGNVTASGDVLIAVNKGGTSYMAFMADASTGDTLIGVPTGQSFDVYVAGVKEIDYATGALAFQQATTISTTATTLTLTPATDVHITDAHGLVIGHTAQIVHTNGGGGTRTPELQVLGTDPTDGSIAMGVWANTAGASSLIFTKSRGAAIGTAAVVQLNDEVGALVWGADDGTDFQSTSAIMVVAVDGTPGTGDMPSRLVFKVTADGAESPTERLRITNTGVITTLSAAAANVTAAGAGIFGGGIAFTDVANAWIDDATHGTGTTSILIGNQTITTSSDRRLKRDIVDSQVAALDMLGRLRVVDYAWGDNYAAHEAYNRRGRWTGLIAQEVIDVVPYIINDGGGRDCRVCREGRVTCKEHGDWFVQYDHLVPMVIKALQELNAKVEALS